MDDCFLPCGRLGHADSWTMRTVGPCGQLDPATSRGNRQKKKHQKKKKNIRKRKKTLEKEKKHQKKKKIKKKNIRKK